MDNDQSSVDSSDATEETPDETGTDIEPNDVPADDVLDGQSAVIEVVPTASDRPVSETVGTGSIFGIGCSIVAILFVCVGIAIFMWRQTN